MSVSSWGFQLIISFKKSIIFCEFIIYFVPKINKIWPNSPWPFSLIPVSILRNKILHLWLNRLCFSFSKTIGHRNRPMGTKLATAAESSPQTDSRLYEYTKNTCIVGKRRWFPVFQCAPHYCNGSILTRLLVSFKTAVRTFGMPQCTICVASPVSPFYLRKHQTLINGQ